MLASFIECTHLDEWDWNIRNTKEPFNGGAFAAYLSRRHDILQKIAGGGAQDCFPESFARMAQECVTMYPEKLVIEALDPFR